MAGFSTSATPCASSITVFLTSGGLSQSQNALVAPAASVPLKIAARKSRHVRPRLACVAALSGGDLKRHAGGGSYERVVALAESARSQETRDAGRAGRGRGAETSHRGRAEEAAMSQPDRTYLAVHRQLEAMSCDFYEIG